MMMYFMLAPFTPSSYRRTFVVFNKITHNIASRRTSPFPMCVLYAFRANRAIWSSMDFAIEVRASAGRVWLFLSD
jgi:hypothetical protein